MSRIQSYTAQRKSVPYTAFELLRVERRVRKELLRSAGISVGLMVIAATLGLLSPLPAMMFVAGSLIGHGLAMRYVFYEYSKPQLNSACQPDRVESPVAA